MVGQLHIRNRAHIPLALWGPNRWHLRSGKATSPSCWKHPISPERDGMPASLVSWAQKASSDGKHLKISKDVEERKNTGKHLHHLCKNLRSLDVPVELHRWNVQVTYGREKQETTDQLNQCIKILVEKCSYASTEEKMRCWLELLFHVVKHFEVKKWVRFANSSKRKQSLSNKLLQHAKQHEATIKDFHQHKSNGGSCNIYHNQWDQNLLQEKARGSWARSRTGSKGKICGKCGTSHPPRECPAWGKKCHKCGNKNHFSTQCRSKQSGGGG